MKRAMLIILALAVCSTFAFSIGGNQESTPQVKKTKKSDEEESEEKKPKVKKPRLIKLKYNKPKSRFGFIGGLNFLTRLPGLDPGIFLPLRPRPRMGAGAVEYEFKSRKAFVIGLFYHYDFNQSTALEVDLLYSQKGVTEKTMDFELNIDYIEIPILFKLQTSASEDFAASLFGGFYGAIKVAAEFESPMGELSFDVERIRGSDVGMTVGGGLRYNKVILNFRYSLGLRTIIDEEDVNVKNSAFTVLLGLEF